MSDATIWVGPSAEVPVVNSNGNIYEQTIVATAAQVLFTLTVFQYTPGTGSIFVFKNGELLRRAVDYTETSATEITLAVGAAAGDKLTFLAFAIAQIDPPATLNGVPQGGTAGQVLTKDSSSDYDSSWQTPTPTVTLLDAARQNIASAATVSLTTIAAATRNIQITGTTQIDGFAVSNGQLWAVKFAGSLILKNNANIVTESGYDIRTSPNDTCFLRAVADNIVEVIGYVRAASSIPRIENNFRLSAVSGTPVPTADTTTNTIYLTPYNGNKISVFNGAAWVLAESAEVSLALAGLTANLPYDVFAVYNAGTGAISLETLAWTNTTTRATALSRQDGVLVKSTDATRRYLGSFQATAVNATIDSERQRLIWNYYNRVDRSLIRQETTASWTYTNTTARQANGSALNQLEVMNGVQEDAINVSLNVTAANSGAISTCEFVNYIGEDATTAAAVGSSRGRQHNTGAGNRSEMVAQLSKTPAVGFHFYAWLESCSVSGTTTWLGSTDSGLMARWRC